MINNGINDFGTGLGFIYITAADGTTIVSSIPNDLNGAEEAMKDALIRGPLSGKRNSVGTFEITGGAGTISNFTINGVAIMGGVAATDINDLRDKINAVGLFTSKTIGNKIYVYGEGSLNNGQAVVATLTGTLTGTVENMANGSDNTGVYDKTLGHRYFVNSNYDVDGCSGQGVAAEPGVLTNTIEITNFLIPRGDQSAMAHIEATIASDVVTFIRTSKLTTVDLATEGGAGTDDLKTIVLTNAVEGDILVLRGNDPAKIVTAKTYVGGNDNLHLAADWVSATAKYTLALQFVGGVWNELFRSPGLELSVSALRAKLLPQEVVGVTTLTLPTNGTTTLEPGVSKGTYKLTGTPTLSGNVVVDITGAPTTPYLDGDKIRVELIAEPVVGTNKITIFGVELTKRQSESGKIVVESVYSLADLAWNTSVYLLANGVDYLTTSDIPEFEEGERPIIVPNTVFVSLAGSDETGRAERFDKPFRTFAEARVAALAMSPSATDRVVIEVFPGEYNETIKLANFVDFKMEGVIVNKTTGVDTTMTDDGVECNSVIYGYPTIKATGSSTGNAFSVSHASSDVKAYANFISEVGAAVACSNGIQTIFGDITSTVDFGAQCVGGSQTIHGNVISLASNGIIATGGTQTVYGNCTGFTGVNANGGTQFVYGNVTSTGGAGNYAAVASGASNLYIQGDLTSPGGGVHISGTPNVTVKGDITATAEVGVFIASTGGTIRFSDGKIKTSAVNTHAIYGQSAGYTLIIKDVVLVPNGTGASIFSSGVAINVINYGAVGTTAVNANVTLIVGTVANNKFIVDAAVI